MRGAKCRADRRVDDYIKSLPSWQQEVCWQVRDLVHAADKDVSETIKRTKLPREQAEVSDCGTGTRH